MPDEEKKEKKSLFEMYDSLDDDILNEQSESYRRDSFSAKDIKTLTKKEMSNIPKKLIIMYIAFAVIILCFIVGVFIR